MIHLAAAKSLSEAVAVPGQSSQPAQPLVTANLWLCCHCQVRLCYSLSWKASPQCLLKGHLSCHHPPDLLAGAWAKCVPPPGGQLKAFPHQREEFGQILMELSDGLAGSAGV